MLNPDKKFAHSDGIDLPIMYVYLAGRIAGECIDKCLEWRQKIIKHYRDYKPLFAQDGETIIGYESYPISFLDALNSKESDSVDKLGLTSALSPNLIYDKDLLSVERADIVVAMMDDYMEEGIQDILSVQPVYEISTGKLVAHVAENNIDFKEAFFKLQEKILNKRPNWGTDCEVAWALYLHKPLILIAGNERQKAMLEKHPFMKRASVIVGSVDELLEKKWLNLLYKSISGAIY